MVELAASADQDEEEAETVTISASHDGSEIGSATVTIRSVSHDATLRKLSLSGIEIGQFSADLTSYGVHVDEAVEATAVTATATHPRASVSISPGPEVSLVEGENRITVTVTAEDGWTTRTYAVTVTRVVRRLTGRFDNVPASHDGSGTVTLTIIFSEPVAGTAASPRARSFSVTNGHIQSARRVNGRDHLWRIEVAPSSSANLVVWVAPTSGCEAPGAVCTTSGKPLSNRPTAIIPGPPALSIAAVASTVTEGDPAAFALTLDRAAPEAMRVSVAVTESGSALPGAPPASVAFAEGDRRAALTVPTVGDSIVEADSIVTATVASGTGYTVGSASSAAVTVEDDDAPAFTVSVAPEAIAEGETATLSVAITNGVTFAEAPPIRLATTGTASPVDYTGVPPTLTLAASADREEEEPETVTAEDGATTQTYTVTVTRAGPPLTAQLLQVPATHDGQAAFTFELRFSREPALSYETLRDAAFQVTGGTVRKAKRLVAGSNLRWEITVEPSSEADVALTLSATADCAAVGAICTAGGSKLARAVSATVSGLRTEAAGFSLARANSRPSGIWSDGQTVWVADPEPANPRLSKVLGCPVRYLYSVR